MLSKQDNSKMKKISIIEEKKNPLFNRKEIKFQIESNITPSYAELEKLITEKFSTHAENIAIKKINGKFGSNNFTVEVNVYNSKKDRDETEPASKKDKAKAEEGAK